MPDFEKPLRDLEIHLCSSEQSRLETKARHSGMDQARKQIAWIALGCVLFGCGAYYFFS